MSVAQMSVDQMSVDQMSVDQMSIDQISVYNKTSFLVQIKFITEDSK
jgi:hypothetical protein